MVYASALLSLGLLAATVVASPSADSRLARRRAARAARRSGIMVPAEGPVDETSAVSYSTNWAGAVFDTQYPAGTFKAVTGTFTVPTPKVPSGGSGSYSSTAWVGIDGDTCTTGLLQTGVDFNVDGGKVSYDAWYEWYPAVSYDFTSFAISAGDEIRTTITASSTTAGTAVIENLTTGKSVTKKLTSTHKLCLQNAEWIVEDFEEGSSLVPFANFGTVTFTDASATTKDGSKVGTGNASLIDIKQSKKVLTSSSLTDSTVTVSYV